MKTVILRKEDMASRLSEMARQIVVKNESDRRLVLVGIRTGGAYLARRLQKVMAGLLVPEPLLGILDITLYRDDWTRIGPAPLVGKTELPFSVDDKTIVLVDDVLYTGRTVRAAMDALMDYGRPRRIELAILADRGDEFRELPIKANYVGGCWNTAANETINVYLTEEGYEDHVAIEKKDP